MKITLKNVSAKNQWREVLKNINLSFETGKVYMLIGPNGSGKSTLLKIIAGLFPYGGEIISDKDIREITGYVFQNPETQIIGSTVFEDIIFGLENIGLSKEEINKRANYVLELLELSHLKDFDPFYLSGGQKQRLAIASILSMEPDFLLLDEVTSMLDQKGKKEVCQAINKIVDQGKGVIVATHELERFVNLADECIYIKDGRVVFVGNPRDGVNLYKNEVVHSEL